MGFSRRLEREWQSSDPTLSFAYSPENVRLGQAIQAFRVPGRVVIGLGEGVPRERLQRVFEPFTGTIVWMSLESAEMTKHAINAFLAMSVVYANEVGRVCEQVGADAREVERGLRSEPRIGERAYVSAGPAIAGGTLARDVAFLSELASRHNIETPVFNAIRESDAVHNLWTQRHLARVLSGVEQPRVALLGLTYKVGTDTLRRSSAVELGRWLLNQGVKVVAFDPAVQERRPEIEGMELCFNLGDVLRGADVAIIAIAWPQFREVKGDTIVSLMRRPTVIDQAAVASLLEDDSRVQYIRVGRPVGAA